MPHTTIAGPCGSCAHALHIEATLRFRYRGTAWWLTGPLLRRIAAFGAPFGLEPELLSETETCQLIGLGASRLRLRADGTRLTARLCCIEQRYPNAALLEWIVCATRPASFDVRLISESRP